jgi:hypothetical protein
MAGVLASSLGVAAMSAPAGAAAPASCKKATFKTVKTKSTSQLTGCTKGPATAATLVANFANLKKITATITWKSGGGVSGPFTITEKAGPKAANKCKFETVKGKKTQDSSIVSTGKVTKGTGKAKSLVGTTFSEILCVTQKVTTYVMPGTTIKI